MADRIHRATPQPAHSRVAAIVDHQNSSSTTAPTTSSRSRCSNIADKVGVHVTTRQPAVDDKWIQTPRGIFPLSDFFVGGTTAADGER